MMTYDFMSVVVLATPIPTTCVEVVLIKFISNATRGLGKLSLRRR